MTAADNNVKQIIDAPPSSITSNPQQGMVEDPRVLAGGSVKGPTPPPLAPCSPLTISSALEQQPAPTAATPTAVAANVPVAVVGGPLMEAPPPSAPNNMAATNTVPSPEEKRWKRTPPTEFDSRKLFVGGLPTNGKLLIFIALMDAAALIFVVLVVKESLHLRKKVTTFHSYSQQSPPLSLNSLPHLLAIMHVWTQHQPTTALPQSTMNNSSTSLSNLVKLLILLSWWTAVPRGAVALDSSLLPVRYVDSPCLVCAHMRHEILILEFPGDNTYL